MSRDTRHTALRTAWAPMGMGLMLALVLGAPPAAAQAPDGAALFRRHCRACHGAEGVPSPGMAAAFPGLRSLADSAFLAAHSVDSLVRVLHNGAGSMKSFSEKLTNEEMAAVAHFVKTLATPKPS